MAAGRLLRPVVPLPKGVGGASPRRSPLAALRDATAAHLAGPPCFVGFSGGRDSSAVLAAAADCARREGLPPPVPVSARFPDAPRTEETRWQERVISHLGLDEWIRVDVPAGEVDVVGPRARAILLRHGLISPANMVFVSLTIEAAAGGRLLTGIGGDDVFVEWRWRELADALEGRRRINRYDILDAAYLRAPRRLQAALDRRFLKPPPPAWLTADARDEAATALAAERSGEPASWPAWLRWCGGRVHIRSVQAAFSALAAEAGTEVAHPLLDPGFLAALGDVGGSRGLGDRSTLMSAVFSEVLPPDVCARPDKARFDEVYWTHHARELVASWDGGGVDSGLVDADALRAELHEPLPDPRSWLLAQSIWLSQNAPARPGA